MIRNDCNLGGKNTIDQTWSLCMGCLVQYQPIIVTVTVLCATDMTPLLYITLEYALLYTFIHIKTSFPCCIPHLTLDLICWSGIWSTTWGLPYMHASAITHIIYLICQCFLHIISILCYFLIIKKVHMLHVCHRNNCTQLCNLHC
jgi:hypothetical protein